VHAEFRIGLFAAVLASMSGGAGCTSDDDDRPGRGAPDAAVPVPVESAPWNPGPIDGNGEGERDVGPPDAGDPPPTDGGTGPVDAGPLPETAARSLRFKRFDQLSRELQRVLALDADEVCRELDRFDCTSEVHRVALGGSQPYFANVYARAREPELNAPLAWERVVLTACAERVDRDFDDLDGAAWLEGLEVDADGHVEPESPAVENAIRTLYREGLLRDPTTMEVADWRQAYRGLEASEEQPARAWSRLLCAAVLTSGEFILY